MRGMTVILEEQFRTIVNNRLKTLGWSRSDLARAANVTPQYVTNYLNGRNTPGTDVMEKLLAALKLRPRIVVEEDAKILTTAG